VSVRWMSVSEADECRQAWTTVIIVEVCGEGWMRVSECGTRVDESGWVLTRMGRCGL